MLTQVQIFRLTLDDDVFNALKVFSSMPAPPPPPQSTEPHHHHECSFGRSHLTDLRVQTAKAITLKVGEGQNALCVEKQVSVRVTCLLMSQSRCRRRWHHARRLLPISWCSLEQMLTENLVARAGACLGDCDDACR